MLKIKTILLVTNSKISQDGIQHSRKKKRLVQREVNGPERLTRTQLHKLINSP
jgi:hypothetical protein